MSNNIEKIYYDLPHEWQDKCKDEDGNLIDGMDDGYSEILDVIGDYIVHLEDTRPNDAKYEELLMAVARKFPNESRHETALRYITEAEARDCGTASDPPKQSEGSE